MSSEKVYEKADEIDKLYNCYKFRDYAGSFSNTQSFCSQQTISSDDADRVQLIVEENITTFDDNGYTSTFDI